jgi:F0F1-type ATP synthase assembly protein I
VAGGIVGALIWLDDGRAKDLLLGMAYGALIGVGAGLILGIIEGSLRVSDGSGHRQAARNRRVRFDIGITPPVRGEIPLPYPSISGTF